MLVQWDLAVDFNRVFYALYYKKTAFDWSAANPLDGALRIVRKRGKQKRREKGRRESEAEKIRSR